ncbi:MAG TPA: toll/interleukin-1 receptor domain-containing protein [Steroidobacteraceae bacterium]|nr:toll/interleukin-1 receptor domain-containing protein [Steroidobacteraceae bacterium]
MNESSAAALAATSLDDDAWDDLLSFIEERRVIPIVGPELLMVSTERGPQLLFDWAAERLAVRLNVSTAELPRPFTLNDVACVFLAQRGRREEAYVRLRSVIKEADFAPPPMLRHLAAITDFDLFVSTTPDSLLETAINLERFAGAPGTEVLAYCPNRVVDLPAERDRLARPVVYHLFGKLAASPTYVISDEDLLEFICALQSEHLVPEKLFHELEHSHLLFIGSNFTNWLARLFLRMAKRQRLSDPRDVGEVLADDHTSEDDRLISFLQQVSVRTRIYVGAERFVEELSRRWQARHKGAAAAAAAGPTRFLPPTREMPDNAVFISYAREDLPAVQQIKAGLDAAGITTWFDIDRLEAGDDYDRKIRSNIARCSYFIPVVSANIQRRLEGYFRREWSYAIDRARNMADGALFILPVSIDGTTVVDALVPDKFKALHFSELPGGRAPPEFVQRLADFMQARGR